MANAGIGTAADLARAVDARQESTVRHHVNGRRGFNIAWARRYARVLKADPVWLFSGDAERAASPEEVEAASIVRDLDDASRRLWLEIGKMFKERGAEDPLPEAPPKAPRRAPRDRR